MEFLDKIILDNSIRNLLIVAAVIVIVLVFKRILSRYIASGLYFVIQTFWKTVERKQFVELVFKPMSWLLSITVALIALNRLNYPAAWDFHVLKIPFDTILEKTGVAIWVILALSAASPASSFANTAAAATSAPRPAPSPHFSAKPRPSSGTAPHHTPWRRPW